MTNHNTLNGRTAQALTATLLAGLALAGCSGNVEGAPVRLDTPSSVEMEDHIVLPGDNSEYLPEDCGHGSIVTIEEQAEILSGSMPSHVSEDLQGTGAIQELDVTEAVSQEVDLDTYDFSPSLELGSAFLDYYMTDVTKGGPVPIFADIAFDPLDESGAPYPEGTRLLVVYDENCMAPLTDGSGK